MPGTLTTPLEVTLPTIVTPWEEGVSALHLRRRKQPRKGGTTSPKVTGSQRRALRLARLQPLTVGQQHVCMCAHTRAR